MDNIVKIKNTFFPFQKTAWTFALLWMLAFILYIPTAKAGWVIDAAGWIYDMKHKGFWDFINRKGSSSQSLYQLFALQYLVCNKLWGMNPWMWSLFYITLHAVNGTLLFKVCGNVLADSEVNNSVPIALCGAILFIICPHVSEVVSWKACYHYLQGFLFILLTTFWAQKYQHTQKSKYARGAAVIFLLSVFALEIFYLIPFFTLSIAIYYRYAIHHDKSIFKKTLLRFFIPQLVVFCIYFILLYAVYGYIRPHKTNLDQPLADQLSKPIKYFFHIIFLARYLPLDLKLKLYAFCSSLKTIIVFYGIAGALFVYGLVRFRKINGQSKAMLLLYTWIMLTIGFLISVNFPGAVLLVFYDRYTYFADGFIYTLLALMVSRFLGNKIAICLFCLYAAVNIYFTARVNGYWKHSGYVINRLLHDFPAPGTKTVLLLNNPENLNGVPMIGSEPEGEFKALYNLFIDSSLKNNIYDVASYNMVTMDDGAHVNVVNDTTIRVTLNQWATWWWYDGHGAVTYENKEYKMNLVDPGHWYELTLKHPVSQYLLLYEVGPNWKTVDMANKNVDQH